MQLDTALQMVPILRRLREISPLCRDQLSEAVHQQLRQVVWRSHEKHCAERPEMSLENVVLCIALNMEALEDAVREVWPPQPSALPGPGEGIGAS
ncbi:MAG: hypothetical protein WAW96_08660 [Alphaproteobacteria bacterium]